MTTTFSKCYRSASINPAFSPQQAGMLRSLICSFEGELVTIEKDDYFFSRGSSSQLKQLQLQANLYNLSLSETFNLSRPAWFSVATVCPLLPHSHSSTQKSQHCVARVSAEKQNLPLPASYENALTSSCDTDERLRPDGL